LDIAFLSHRLEGGGAYGKHTMFILGFLESAYIGLVDFLLVLIELFFASLGVTAESLRAKEIENRPFRSNAVSLIQNFR